MSVASVVSSFEARVAGVRDSGNGAFIVCYPTDPAVDLGARAQQGVTVNLADWQGPGRPKRGQIVHIADVALFETGWRGGSASPILPTRLQTPRHQTRRTG